MTPWNDQNAHKNAHSIENTGHFCGVREWCQDLLIGFSQIHQAHNVYPCRWKLILGLVNNLKAGVAIEPYNCRPMPRTHDICNFSSNWMSMYINMTNEPPCLWAPKMSGPPMLFFYFFYFCSLFGRDNAVHIITNMTWQSHDKTCRCEYKGSLKPGG